MKLLRGYSIPSAFIQRVQLVFGCKILKKLTNILLVGPITIGMLPPLHFQSKNT